MAESEKLNIFDVLKRINSKKTDFTEAELKQLQPVVILRWLTGTSNEAQINIINSFANKHCWGLHKHKELLVNLMSTSTTGRFTKYQWLKRTTKKSSGSLSTINSVVAQYYNYSLRQASGAANMLNDDVIIRYAEELGLQKDQMTKLKKELRSR